MTDPKDPHNDEHIEDLLSQLQGIFGKLSQSEEEESQQKVDLPPKAPSSGPVPLPPAPIMDPSPPGAPPIQRSEPVPVFTPPPVEQPVPPEPPEPSVIASVPEIPASPPVEVEPPAAAPIEPLPPVEDDGGSVPTVIYYPAGREADAKTLAQKLETMAPKFTKVAFQLHVNSSVPYDLKSEPRDTIINQTLQQNVRALFFVVERPLDDARKKAMAAQLEPRGIYFQEVPLLSIEKKAFYTDLLLGLVFFFDSLKSSNGRSGSEG